MNETDQIKILELENIHSRISPEFSCHLCKQSLNIPSCDGCPIHCQNFTK